MEKEKCLWLKLKAIGEREREREPQESDVYQQCRNAIFFVAIKILILLSYI